jgi:hypothetical protein
LTDEIVSLGVMLTQALVEDGVVKTAEKRPSLDELKKMLV